MNLFCGGQGCGTHPEHQGRPRLVWEYSTGSSDDILPLGTLIIHLHVFLLTSASFFHCAYTASSSNCKLASQKAWFNTDRLASVAIPIVQQHIRCCASVECRILDREHLLSIATTHTQASEFHCMKSHHILSSILWGQEGSTQCTEAHSCLIEPHSTTIWQFLVQFALQARSFEKPACCVP